MPFFRIAAISLTIAALWAGTAAADEITLQMPCGEGSRLVDITLSDEMTQHRVFEEMATRSVAAGCEFSRQSVRIIIVATNQSRDTGEPLSKVLTDFSEFLATQGITITDTWTSSPFPPGWSVEYSGERNQDVRLRFDLRTDRAVVEFFCPGDQHTMQIFVETSVRLREADYGPEDMRYAELVFVNVDAPAGRAFAAREERGSNREFRYVLGMHSEDYESFYKSFEFLRDVTQPGNILRIAGVPEGAERPSVLLDIMASEVAFVSATCVAAWGRD